MHRLNHRARKTLDYKTPHAVFFCNTMLEAAWLLELHFRVESAFLIRNSGLDPNFFLKMKEIQASEKLLGAAKTLSEQPEAIQLRYLQTLTEIAGEKSSTIVFPLDFFKKIMS